MMKTHESLQARYLRKPLATAFAILLIIGILLGISQPGPVLAGPNSYSNLPQTILPPNSIDWANLGSIYKTASKPMLFLGETLTYIIHLEIGWNATYLVDVSDPIPVGMDYVDGSANEGGFYDPTTRTVIWKQKSVAYGAPLNLTFEVKDVLPVTQPSPVVNVATISVNGYILQRLAWVTLMPPNPGSNLSASFKSAVPELLYPGDTVSYAIHLINTGNSPALVQVMDPVPAPLRYVPGSASDGGVYDETNHTIIWKDILVPPIQAATIRPGVLLTFKAIAPLVLPSNLPIVITNTATISSGTVAFQRSAKILLTLKPYNPLEGSYKTASQRVVIPGQKFTYYIDVHNSSVLTVTTNVIDPLPADVSYVPGSANAGGVYDPATRTITWKDLSVIPGNPLILKFDVIASNTTATGIKVLNTAEIWSGGMTVKRSVVVLLMPYPNPDPVPPIVRKFVIGDQDVQTSPEVKLHIDAVDNIKVSQMFLKEWVLETRPFPHWKEVQSSGWIPYQPDYPWTLTKQSGTHFMGVWVADPARNRSRLTLNAIDFASLLLPSTYVGPGEMVPYLVYYPAGVEVTAVLKFESGWADLFVWKPGNMLAPDMTGPTPGDVSQTITFTTRSAGIYLFLVYGLRATAYDLSITPGGGPRLPVPILSLVPLATGVTIQADSLSPTAITDGITVNPILPESGLDPLSIAVDPPEPLFNTYLPATIR